MFNVSGSYVKNLIKDSSCHCPEAMTCHGVAIIFHASQCCKNSHIAHGPCERPSGREDIPASTGELSQFFQYFYRLLTQRYNVGLSRLHLVPRYVPDFLFQIELGPLCFTKLPWAHKEEGSKFQCAFHNKMSRIRIYRPEEWPNFIRISYGCMMSFSRLRQCSL